MLARHVAAHRSGLREAPVRLHAREQDSAVLFRGEVVGLDRGRREWIGAADRHAAPALRPQQPRRDREPGKAVQPVARLVEAVERDAGLDVRRRGCGVGADEARRKRLSHCQKSLAQKSKAQRRDDAFRYIADHVVERDRLGAFIHDAARIMILQVRAHAGKIGDDCHPRRFRSRRGPTPESCSNCGELNDPPATTTSTRAVADPGIPLRKYSTPVARVPREHDARRVRARDHPEIRAVPRRAQVTGRRAAAQSSAYRPLVVAEAFLGCAVEIGIAPVTAFLGCREIGVGERVPSGGSETESGPPVP